ncbi:protein phosphatase CheZ [Alteromonas macleodii]|uniref:protein phosphatase CheZ n=1 Tax=Alteromonas macleodii TaxID=28108 RepID=UPI003140ABAD
MKPISVKEAENLLSLVKAGEHHQANLFLSSVVTPNGHQMLAEIEKLLADIESSRSEALAGLEGDLATSAAYRCQNALEQLAYIVEQGSDAANVTLHITEKLAEKVSALAADGKLSEVVADELNSMLMEIMLKQSYQDLTEQVVVKLKDFVQRIESSLSQLVDLKKAGACESSLGPSVTTFEKQFTVDAQDDIDSLLQAAQPGEA